MHSHKQQQQQQQQLSSISLSLLPLYARSSREEAAATDIHQEHADAHLQAVPKISSGAAWQRRAKLSPKVSNFSAEKKQQLAAKEEP